MKYSKITIYALVAALGALVVGLNLGGISGAIDIIERNFGLTTFSKGFVTSALMVGCLFGAFIGGSLSDRHGRRPVMMASAILLLLSSSGCSLLSFNATHLVIFRLIGGLGVGMLSAVIPTYIAEISPAAYRGTFISFYQVFVVIGIFIAYICNYWFFGMDSNWKLMLGLPIAFAILYIVFLIGIPESPRWLVQCNRQDDAKSSIKTFCFGPEDTEDILNSANGNKNEEVAFSELFKGKTGKVVFLGCMLAFFQQITGINVVINYAPSIFSSLNYLCRCCQPGLHSHRIVACGQIPEEDIACYRMYRLCHSARLSCLCFRCGSVQQHWRAHSHTCLHWIFRPVFISTYVRSDIRDVSFQNKRYSHGPFNCNKLDMFFHSSAVISMA